MKKLQRIKRETLQVRVVARLCLMLFILILLLIRLIFSLLN